MCLRGGNGREVEDGGGIRAMVVMLREGKGELRTTAAAAMAGESGQLRRLWRGKKE